MLHLNEYDDAGKFRLDKVVFFNWVANVNEIRLCDIVLGDSLPTASRPMVPALFIYILKLYLPSC